MSTSLLYHAFGIREYNYVRTQYHAGNVIFTVERKPLLSDAPAAQAKMSFAMEQLCAGFIHCRLGIKPAT